MLTLSLDRLQDVNNITRNESYTCQYSHTATPIPMKLDARSTWLATLALSCSTSFASANSRSISLSLANSWEVTSHSSPVLLVNDSPKAGLPGLEHAGLPSLTVKSRPRRRPHTLGQSVESQHVIQEEEGRLFPDVTDRITLLNFARASYDAYHPVPVDDGSWRPVEGYNWVRVYLCAVHQFRKLIPRLAILVID